MREEYLGLQCDPVHPTISRGKSNNKIGRVISKAKYLGIDRRKNGPRPRL